MDSIAASTQGLQLVNQKRLDKGWNRTAEIWCRQAFTTRSTLNRFWAGKPIRRETFIAICEVVGVDWQMVGVQEYCQARESLGARESRAPTYKNANISCPYLTLLLITYLELEEIQQSITNLKQSLPHLQTIDSSVYLALILIELAKSCLQTHSQD